MYTLIIFKTIGYKLTASGNIIHLIVNYKFMRPVRILLLPKNKTGKNSKLKQTLSKKIVNAIRKWTFQYKLFYFQLNYKQIY